MFNKQVVVIKNIKKKKGWKAKDGRRKTEDGRPETGDRKIC